MYFLTNFDGRGILVFWDNHFFESFRFPTKTPLSKYRLPPLHPANFKKELGLFYKQQSCILIAPRPPVSLPSTHTPSLTDFSQIVRVDV